MKKVIALGLLALSPMFASAALTVAANSDLSGVLAFVNSVLGVATTLLLALAVVWFLYGVFEFVMNSGSEDKRKEGQSRMIAGIIGIAVMVSVWGLVKIITNTFGTAGQTSLPAPVVPQIPTNG